MKKKKNNKMEFVNEFEEVAEMIEMVAAMEQRDELLRNLPRLPEPVRVQIIKQLSSAKLWEMFRDAINPAWKEEIVYAMEQTEEFAWLSSETNWVQPVEGGEFGQMIELLVGEKTKKITIEWQPQVQFIDFSAAHNCRVLEISNLELNRHERVVLVLEY